ncbi:NAD(P)H-dependent oxidoreductase [Uliginosibacterium aquaticum]|uniref:NAD(P)H-dependent oxidoreductase n=1 Tax=Uliginosibacterium aquaticum TaxID=2731212 RepID=A0ABX2IDN8_9RHOO|nr:NAD(P)H-dependent oxidoreductase [Uliginosibacterium aquaticum]NSL54710.1 NAD(P)H-dependent oxidoreductase [Uliginosibacterium aquaticum]
MKILIVLAHPQPGSFNHALADTVRSTLEAAGHQVSLRDLYAEGFDPLFTPEELTRGHQPGAQVREHIDLLLNADSIVVIHPNWWAQAPAILKGWLDRVLRAGEAYRFGTNEKGEGVIIGLLKAKAALVFTTSNTPREAELRLYGDPLDNFWKACVWGFCGVPLVSRRNFESIIVSTPEQRAGWLAEAAALTRSVLLAD